MCLKGDMNKIQKHSCSYFMNPTHKTSVIFCYDLGLNWRKGGFKETNEKLFNIHISIICCCALVFFSPSLCFSETLGYFEKTNLLLIVVLIKIVLDSVFCFFKSTMGSKGMEKQATQNYLL